MPKVQRLKPVVALAGVLACLPLLTAAELTVSSDFPGGSALVKSIDQAANTIEIEPREYTERYRGWRCWWYCKISGLADGQSITLKVRDPEVKKRGRFGLPDRAAFSTDQKKWQLLSDDGSYDAPVMTYRYTHKGDEGSAWFAWREPYLLAEAEALTAELKAKPFVETFELCKSAEGRAVPAFKIRDGDTPDSARLGIWFHGRHHAWEQGGSWICQGLGKWLVSDDERAVALRKKALIYFVPMMDVDNAETGCGGKDQTAAGTNTPAGDLWDFNRTWMDEPVWPQVKAALALIRQMNSGGGFDLFLDLHNPGPENKQSYFYRAAAHADPIAARNRDSFLAAAKAEIKGKLPYTGKHDQTSDATYDKNWTKISKNYVQQITRPYAVALTFETAWNTAQSTSENWEKQGAELGKAIELYFREERRK